MPPRLLQDTDEQQLRYGVAPQPRVELPARAPQCTQRTCAHPAQVAVLLHEQETLENRARLAFEEILAARFQQRAARLEALIEFARRGIGHRRTAGLQVL